MPPTSEKQPSWLMGCKCGARVKASRVSRQNRWPCWNFGREPGKPRGACRRAPPPDSGVNGVRHQHRLLRELTLPAAPEQHPPLEGGGPHDRIALEHLLAEGREIRRHQAE